jgi:hypothetical protein
MTVSARSRTRQRQGLTLAGHEFAREVGSQVSAIRWRRAGDCRAGEVLALYQTHSRRIDMLPYLTRGAESDDPARFAEAALVLCHEIWHGATRSEKLGRIEEGCVELLAWHSVNELLEMSGWTPRRPYDPQAQAWGLISQREHLHYASEVRWLRSLARRCEMDPVDVALRLISAKDPQRVMLNLMQRAAGVERAILRRRIERGDDWTRCIERPLSGLLRAA